LGPQKISDTILEQKVKNIKKLRVFKNRKSEIVIFLNEGTFKLKKLLFGT
jgi:hypothetical protein